MCGIGAGEGVGCFKCGIGAGEGVGGCKYVVLVQVKEWIVAKCGIRAGEEVGCC